MTYEEKYNQAIDVIKKIREANKDNAALVDFIEYNYPELKEDEDEIIRKELISYLSDKGTKSPFKEEEIDCERFIAWLEKQKTIETDYDKAFDEFLDSIPEKDPESCNSLYTYEDLEAAIKFGIQWEKQKKPTEPFDYSCVNVSQKDWSELSKEVDEEDYGIDGLWHAVDILERTLGKVEGYQSDDGILEHKAAITAVKRLNEQNPVEWSEEDIIYIQYAVDGLERYIKEHPDPEFGNATPCEKAAVRWLKSLKDRCLPPKQEWSEEDDTRLQQIVTALESYNEWHVANGYGVKFKEDIAWLKTLHTKKHYKPTDAQLEALQYALGNGGKYNNDELQSLYNQLKQL